MPPGIRPAWITDVTQTGILTLKFYRPIYVPLFIVPSDDAATNNDARKLTQMSNITLQEYITNSTLDISIMTFEGKERVNWTCSNLTETSLIVQLFFDNPTKISTQRTDLLTVKVLDRE